MIASFLALVLVAFASLTTRAWCQESGPPISLSGDRISDLTDSDVEQIAAILTHDEDAPIGEEAEPFLEKLLVVLAEEDAENPAYISALELLQKHRRSLLEIFISNPHWHNLWLGNQAVERALIEEHRNSRALAIPTGLERMLVMIGTDEIGLELIEDFLRIEPYRFPNHEQIAGFGAWGGGEDIHRGAQGRMANHLIQFKGDAVRNRLRTLFAAGDHDLQGVLSAALLHIRNPSHSDLHLALDFWDMADHPLPKKILQWTVRYVANEVLSNDSIEIESAIDAETVARAQEWLEKHGGGRR